MNPLLLAYNEVLFRPLFNLLVGLTNILPNHNVGLAIIGVTFVVRLVLLPASIHQARQAQANQEKMAALSDELKKITKQHKDNPTQKAQATMALYRKAGISPAAGCLPLLIQLPILIALYRVFLVGMGPETWPYLYSFVSQPSAVSLYFLGLDLASKSALLAILAGIAQFVQMYLFSPAAPNISGSDDSAKTMAAMQKNMTYIFPVMTVFIAWSLPAALALYWVVSTLFGLIQQYVMKKTLKLSVNIPTT